MSGLADRPIGRFSSLARSSMASIHTFRHLGDHVDPREEWIDVPSVMFTRGDAWQFRSATASGRVDDRHALAAGGGVAYSSRHDGRRPTDRTLDVALKHDLAGPLVAGFHGRAAVVAVTPELHAARSRLATVALAAGRPRLGLDLAVADVVRLAFGGTSTPSEAATPDAVDAALEHMRSRLADDLDLAGLARAAAVSPFHFSRLFARRVGEPPLRHLRRLRLERAALLLRETDAAVTEVALDVGFGSLSYFVSSFRAAFGASPSRWRRARARRPN